MSLFIKYIILYCIIIKYLIIDINKDGTPNYAVWRYYANAKTKIITSIKIVSF